MNSQFKQTGATLIVVLIMLVAITIIGTLAVRQSMVTLGVATNSQAQQLMMQNADAVYFNVEDGENLVQALTTMGMFGYIDGAANKDKELVFCFLGDQADFFDITRASLIFWEQGKSAPTNDALGMDGYCEVGSDSANYYTSGRRAVMTQVAVKMTSAAETDAFYGQVLGSDNGVVKFVNSKPVSVYAISIMPTLSSETNANINTCLNSRMNEVTIPANTTVASNSVNRQSVTDCLSSRNIPFNSFEQDYFIAQDFE